MWRHREKIAIYEARERPQKKPTLTLPWSRTSRFQNYETKNFCCLSHAFLVHLVIAALENQDVSNVNMDNYISFLILNVYLGINLIKILQDWMLKVTMFQSTISKKTCVNGEIYFMDQKTQYGKPVNFPEIDIGLVQFLSITENFVF